MSSGVETDQGDTVLQEGGRALGSLLVHFGKGRLNGLFQTVDDRDCLRNRGPGGYS